MRIVPTDEQAAEMRRAQAEWRRAVLRETRMDVLVDRLACLLSRRKTQHATGATPGRDDAG